MYLCGYCFRIYRVCTIGVYIIRKEFSFFFCWIWLKNKLHFGWSCALAEQILINLSQKVQFWRVFFSSPFAWNTSFHCHVDTNSIQFHLFNMNSFILSILRFLMMNSCSVLLFRHKKKITIYSLTVKWCQSRQTKLVFFFSLLECNNLGLVSHRKWYVVTQ